MHSEEGSIIPLGVAAICLSVVLTLVFVELTGVEIQTLRNKQLSDALALKVATDLKTDAISPVVGLEYAPAVQGLTQIASQHLGIDPTAVSILSRDGKTLEALVCTTWESITGLSFELFGKVCATSKARAI
jgi:hypothetical protein